MMKSRLRASVPLAVLAATCLSTPSMALAQTEPQASQDRATIEDIVVTARRQSETLMSVPVQVNVQTGEQLARTNATDLPKIAENIPFVTITKISGGNGGGLIVRGLGAVGSDVGIQQTVLLNIDNVFVGRGRIVAQSFYDIGQVEVLKGPQALFYGKNSPAGVISVSTKDPGQTLEGFVRAGYEFNADERFIEGAVSVPVTPTFAVRLAGRASGMKGYIRNNANGYAVNPLVGQAAFLAAFPIPASPGRTPKTDDIAGRVTAVWTPTPELKVKLKYAYGLSHANGDNGVVEITCRPGTALPTTLGVADTKSDCGGNQQTALSNMPVGLTVNHPYANGGVAYADTQTHLASLNLDYNGDNFDASSITGYYKLKYNGAQNPFHDSLATSWASQPERSRGFSQELRANTKWDSAVNAVVGTYYGTTRQFTQSFSYIAHLGLDPVTNSYYTYARFALQKSTTYSAFAQLQWTIVDGIQFDAGARYTREKRTDFQGNAYVHPRQAGFRPAGNYLNRSRVFTDWSPEATLTWHPADGQTVYGAYKTGYKSGGFSAPGTLTAALTDASTRFDPEDVEGFEVGYKGRLLDRRLSFQLAAYRYNYSNQQVTVFIPDVLGFIVSNAGKSRVQGIESQVTFRATPELTIDAALGYNDAHFVRFTGAACYAGQTAAQGCLPTGVGTNTAQDLSGTTLPRAPKWAGNISGVYQKPINDRFKVTLSGGAIYSSSFNSADSLEPSEVSKSAVKINASVALGTIDDKFELSLIGRNLTDKYIAQLSVAKARGGVGQYASYFNRPREILLQGTIRY